MIAKRTLTESILKNVGIDDTINERLNSINGSNIYFDVVPLVPLDITEIDIGYDHPVIQAIKLTIKSGNRIPSSSNTGGPCDFYEEVNFYLRGMGDQPATATEIKEMLSEMLGGK